MQKNNDEKKINYFPGHMKKGLDKIEDKLNIIDFVVILLDSRIPYSSLNKLILNKVKDKPKLFLLTKKDLSIESETLLWEKKLENNSNLALSLNLLSQKDIEKIFKKLDVFLQEKKEKYLKKSIKNVVSRGMIIGIPNVGKSTLINLLNKRSILKTGNKPGVTKNINFVKISKELELMDTPGILSPRIDDNRIAINLALVGTIKEEVLPIEYVFIKLIEVIKKNYLKEFNVRYDSDFNIESNIEEIILYIGKKRGFIKKNSIIDKEKTMKVILNEFRNGKISKVTLERSEDVEF